MVCEDSVGHVLYAATYCISYPLQHNTTDNTSTYSYFLKLCNYSVMQPLWLLSS